MVVYWVSKKQFACEFTAKHNAKPPYAGRHLPSLKCDPNRILELRAEYPDAVSRAAIPTGARGSRSIWAPVFPRVSSSTPAT